MAWFKRSGSGDTPNDSVSRLVQEALDPLDDRAVVIDGDQALVNPGQILDNIRARMERIDLDPDTPWAPEDLMSEDEATLMFVNLLQGELVVTETAWYARQVLSRWPADLVESQIVEGARIEMFLEGPRIEPEHGDIARRVMNRALCQAERVDEHPELEELADKDLLGVWLAIVFWFGIKSGM